MTATEDPLVTVEDEETPGADIDVFVSSMRAFRDRRQARADALQRQVDSVKDDIRRVDSAIRALERTGVYATGEDRPATKTKRPKSRDWRPRQEVIDAVEREVIERGETTVPELRDSPDLDFTDSMVSRAMRVLRDEERVRLAGRRGMALLYKPMKTRIKEDGDAAV